MKYRIEITGCGGEALIGKVNREFYNRFIDDSLDIADYVWNEDFFTENEDVVIPEDIRPFEPGEWTEGAYIVHEYGVPVDSLYVTVTRSDEVILDNIGSSVLSNIGATFESVEEFFTDELLEDGDTHIAIQLQEKGFFQSYEFDADSFNPNRLTFQMSSIDGWDLVTSIIYDDQELEELGELSTVAGPIGLSDAWLGKVEKENENEMV
jgi:hypothetical protein